MPGPLVSSAATSALMTTSLGEFPKQTLIAARARVKCGSCPSTSECVARAGSGRWRTWRRWIRAFDSWSRDRQTVMGGGPALETGADLSGNRKFESISLQQTVCLSPASVFEGREPRLSARLCAAGLATGSSETRSGFHFVPTGGSISVWPVSSAAVPLMWSARMPRWSKVGPSPGIKCGRSLNSDRAQVKPSMVR
jgi:hypothetical protein